jgi:hypothetical protein
LLRWFDVGELGGNITSDLVCGDEVQKEELTGFKLKAKPIVCDGRGGMSE